MTNLVIQYGFLKIVVCDRVIFLNFHLHLNIWRNDDRKNGHFRFYVFTRSRNIIFISYAWKHAYSMKYFICFSHSNFCPFYTSFWIDLFWKKKQKLKKNIQVNCDTWIGKLSHTYSLIAFKIVIKVFGFYYNGTLVASIALGHWFTLNTFKNNLLIIKVSLYSFVSFRFVYMLSETRVKCVRACTHTFIWLIYGWISSFLF